MFSYPQAPDAKGVEGRTDAKPIVIPGISVESFELLLGFLHIRRYDDTPPFSIAEWIEILRIATRFEFGRVRTRAIEEITREEHQLNAVEEILLSRDCDVPQWMRPALTKLVARATTMTGAEAAQLPLDMVVDIWRAHNSFHGIENHSGQGFHHRYVDADQCVALNLSSYYTLHQA
ncbi:hypothetical protein BV25DRAFT_1826972 [Artomyces pyxidatus]|uniref:Uncharacterized protein n=1 Tax=Artomyces pyxidatus TaxID=48021 RepID=A0ACB8SXE0_9AGAM|nr:hypothetical protein BV25DRAFT_1826972 [Artomyces pyxidatus]